MRKFYTVVLAIALVCVLASVSQAKTVTNRGEVITVTTMDERTEGSTTVVENLSKPPSGTTRDGNYVFHYEVPEAGVTGAVDLVAAGVIPKGTIFLENCVIEVTEGILPNDGTPAIKIAGGDILAAANTLESTGIDAGVATPFISTTNDYPYLVIDGSIATQGEFTVYCPVMLGNQQ